LRGTYRPVGSEIYLYGFQGASLEKILTRAGATNNLAQEMSPLDEGFRRHTAEAFEA
jgi:hypothetical protein